MSLDRMTGLKARYRRMKRLPLLSPRQWVRRMVFWVGAIMIALVATVFAQAADLSQDLFRSITAGHPYLIFLLAPAGLTIAVLLTRTIFQGAQGSGIPQWTPFFRCGSPSGKSA
jgi:H+/Cl- antiporter ClcA